MATMCRTVRCSGAGIETSAYWHVRGTLWNKENRLTSAKAGLLERMATRSHEVCQTLCGVRDISAREATPARSASRHASRCATGKSWHRPHRTLAAEQRLCLHFDLHRPLHQVGGCGTTTK